MTFSAADLADSLEALERIAVPPARFVIAFSGGLDSAVLLHALASLKVPGGRYDEVPMVAVHVDHGLQDESAEWNKHCETTAAGLAVEYRVLKVEVDLDSGMGPEASAREVRYAALKGELAPGDWLLSAHHREDQAETLLLNLVRGSGPAGVAGIGSMRRFSPGWLARPMLNVGRADIREYADNYGIGWVEDPSNTDRRFDRNFLRHEILPRLKARWPDIAARLQRSSGHAGEASELLAELAKADLLALGGAGGRLPIDGLKRLSRPRQRNVLRYALRAEGLSTPSAVKLGQILDEVIPARVDAQPLVSWPGTSVRRYRNGLYLLPGTLADEIVPGRFSGDERMLGTGLGTLSLLHRQASGLAPALVDEGLSIRSRSGGEEFQPQGQSHTRKLKKLLQEEGIVPWMRDRLPLVYSGGRLVAVGDLWLAADAVTSPGVVVRWIGRPALH